MNVLFVCSRNRLRSPTAEAVFASTNRSNSVPSQISQSWYPSNSPSAPRCSTSPWFAVVYEAPQEAPVVLAAGAQQGLLPQAWTFDAHAAGSRLVVIGADEDLAGQPVEQVLAFPVQLIVPLR